MRKVVVVLLVFTIVAATLATLVATGEQRVVAAGPCGTPHDALDSDELELLQRFQVWRDQNLENSSVLVASGPLNAAAAWFAEYVAAGGSTNGHSDEHGRDYFDRALDCGWPYLGGMGEGGVYAATLDEAASSLPHTSVATMMVPPTPNYPPVKCAGVGRATVDNSTVWIVLLAQFPAGQECPQSVTSGPTATATATNTPTPSPTPTPTPVPTSWSMWAPGVTSND